MNNAKEEAFIEAVRVMERCSFSHGFHAAFPGYAMVFARDSMIVSLGASLFKDKFKEAFKQSLITLSKYQSKKGQIPNAVDIFSTRKKHVDYQSIDSTLWFIIGHFIYRKRYSDERLFIKYKNNIEKAFEWLSFQDMGEDGMLEQLPTTDWQDAFPHRYGHTINTQALYYRALTLAGKNKEADRLKTAVNNGNDSSLWNGYFYLPWRWKNHNKYQEKGEWFDSLGNLLAILFDLADKKKAEKIMLWIKKKGIDKPYPVKAIYPSIHKGDQDWQEYYLDCEAGNPNHYLNAGIWTFIGGFYVLALIKMKKFSEAEKALEMLAKANMQHPKYSEWLNGINGKPGESGSGKDEGNQAWNAGIYALAYLSLKEKKVLL